VYPARSESRSVVLGASRAAVAGFGGASIGSGVGGRGLGVGEAEKKVGMSGGVGVVDLGVGMEADEEVGTEVEGEEEKARMVGENEKKGDVFDEMTRDLEELEMVLGRVDTGPGVDAMDNDVNQEDDEVMVDAVEEVQEMDHVERDERNMGDVVEGETGESLVGVDNGNGENSLDKEKDIEREEGEIEDEGTVREGFSPEAMDHRNVGNVAPPQGIITDDEVEEEEEEVTLRNNSRSLDRSKNGEYGDVVEAAMENEEEYEEEDESVKFEKALERMKETEMRLNALQKVRIFSGVFMCV
jgi:hypothetical protein